jgi:hypothetical protein
MLKRLVSVFLVAIPFAVLAHSLSSEPVLKKGMFPTYPPCAIEKRVQGTVRIKAFVNSDGRVDRAIPVGKDDEELVFPELKNDAQFAYQCLCQAAQKAALNWEFAKGSKVREVVLLFRFELVDGVPIGEDLYPIYIAPFEAQIRGLVPPIIVSTGAEKPGGR